MAKKRLKIATWNINSVRLRIGLVEKFVLDHGPDVLCLQETKCQDSEFPAAAFEAMGLRHLAIHGQKSYNGVAIASRLPLDVLDSHVFGGEDHARHISVKVAGIKLHNFYVPAGGDEPDPVSNPKFAHKLAYLKDATAHFKKDRTAAQIMVGDLNIAPLEHDVWSHKQLLDVVSHTPVEVEALAKWQASKGWVDIARHFTPEPEKLYSWWSYRAADWAAADRGRRLDHIWLTPDLKDAAQGMSFLREARGWEKPSDHVPVTLSLTL